MQPSFSNTDVGTCRTLAGAAHELPSARFVWSLRLICTVALGISVYLAWTAFSMGQVFGCSGGDVFDCGHVLTSHWSKVMGIPVSVPAAGLYASLIALLVFARRGGPTALRQLVWGGMTLGSVMAGLAALWFIGLQIFVLEHYCPYCLIVHSCGIVLACTVLASRLCPASLKLKSSGLSLLGVSALIVVQGLTPKADQFEIVHYDEVEPANVTTLSVVDGNQNEVFEAPGEAFAPPGDVFEPPVLRDANSDSNAIRAEDSASRSSEELKNTNAKDEQPTVASTLLLIVPPQIMQFSNLVVALQDASDDLALTATATDTVTKSADERKKGREDNEDSGKQADTTASEAASVESNETPTAEAPKPTERRLLTFAGNRFTLDVKQWPLLGKTDAKFVFVEMFDYTCPHCRNTHQAIAGAQKQYGNDLAIFALPVPLEGACNPSASGGGHPGACEMAQIAVAVWRIAPDKFQTFHDWMFQGHRTASTAKQFAETLVGKDRLKTELTSAIPRQYISRHVSLYQKVGSGQVPKLIFPATTMQGEVNSTSTLCNAIERELAVARK